MSQPLQQIAPTSGEFFPSLDGIRGLAVLSVVIYHTAYFNPNVPLQKLLFCLTKAGFMGVPIFFVLSGFLIAFTIIKTKDRFNLFHYATRRAAKILPPFILSLVVFSLLSMFWKNPENIFLSSLAYLSTIANFTRGWDEINPVFWSLMVEIHFYIVFPPLYFFLRRFFRYPELIAALILFIVPITARSVTHLDTSSDLSIWFHNANMFPKALDNFVLGILFAHILSNKDRYQWLIRKSRPLCALGIILLCLSYLGSAIYDFSKSPEQFARASPNLSAFEIFRYLPAFGTFFLLFCVFLPIGSLVDRVLGFPPLQYLGVISYEWFLFHYPPVQFLASVVGNAGGSGILYAARTLLPFFATLAFSAIVYHFVSKPILDWSKSRLRQRCL